MRCPSCGAEMNEVSKWQMAPYGGWECPNCGLKISKKTSSGKRIVTGYKIK